MIMNIILIVLMIGFLVIPLLRMDMKYPKEIVKYNNFKNESDSDTEKS